MKWKIFTLLRVLFSPNLQFFSKPLFFNQASWQVWLFCHLLTLDNWLYWFFNSNTVWESSLSFLCVIQFLRFSFFIKFVDVFWTFKEGFRQHFKMQHQYAVKLVFTSCCNFCILFGKLDMMYDYILYCRLFGW